MSMDGLPLGEADVPADQKMLLLPIWPGWITESLLHRVCWHAKYVVLDTLKNEQPDTPFFPGGFWVGWDGYLEESCAAHLWPKCRGDLWSSPKANIASRQHSPGAVHLPYSSEKPMKSTVPVVPVLSLGKHLSELLMGSTKTCPLVSKPFKSEGFSTVSRFREYLTNKCAKLLHEEISVYS